MSSRIRAFVDSLAPERLASDARRRPLDPAAPATDSRVYGRVRDERSQAETVALTGDEADALTTHAELVAAAKDLDRYLEDTVLGRTPALLSLRRRLQIAIDHVEEILP